MTIKTDSIGLQTVAMQYAEAGLCALPAERVGDTKRPLGKWSEYQTRLPTTSEIMAKFHPGVDHICVVTGPVSGQLEVLDFDMAGEAFDQWYQSVQSAQPGLCERLVIETSPSGGRHVFYRCHTKIGQSVKLAQRRIEAQSSEELLVCRKRFKPRQDENGRWHVIATLIETRGDRSVCLCAPSPGYILVQGSLTKIPTVSAAEREVMLQAAWSLDEVLRKPIDGPRRATGADRPGDDFNARGDVRAVLQRHGWVLASEGPNEHWRRPGKSDGTSATLKDRVFYVFSSNAAPFEAMQAYSPFAVYTLLEHEGNWSAAAKHLRGTGYRVQVTGGGEQPHPLDTPHYRDPGPMPVGLLRIPGFVGELMDFCLETAPYPNTALAFSGALAMQAVLAGRNVRDTSDTRPNVYILSLAHSAAGKDHPRKLNARLLHALGMTHCLTDRLASGEGLQDALHVTPTMLAQTDEIDGLLQSINRSRDGRQEALLGTLLTMYSSSGSIVPVRRLAGQNEHKVIDQPCLVLFGTAVPNHYYAALSERMMTNGFFARMSIFEAGTRGAGQEPTIREIPERVMESAHRWATMFAGQDRAFLSAPMTVTYSLEASSLVADYRHEIDHEYQRAVDRADAVAATVLGRVGEHIRKFALLYSLSEDPLDPRISADAMRWAYRLVKHQADRMLFMASEHAAETPFEESALKAIRKLREAPGRTLTHSTLLKRMKMKAREFQELIDTLVERGEVQRTETHSGGRCGVVYWLVGPAQDGKG